MGHPERQPGDRRPPPGVGGRRWRGWILALVGLLVIGVAPFYLVRLPPVRDWLVARAGHQAGLGPDARLRVARILRFDPFHLWLEDVVWEMRDGASDWRARAHASRLGVSWSARDLLAGRLAVDRLWADSLEIVLPPTRAGAEPPRAEAAEPWRLPVPRLPRLRIGQVRISPLEIADSSGVRLVGGLTLADLESGPDGISGQLRRGWVRLGQPELELGLAHGRLAIWRDGGMTIDGLRLVAGGSRGELSAARLGAEPLRVTLALEHCEPGPLLAPLLPGVRWEPGDSLAGSIECWWSPGEVGADLSLAGRLLGECLAGAQVRVRAAADSVELESLWLSGDVGDLSGHGRWLRGERSVELAAEWSGLRVGSAWLPWLQALPLEAPCGGDGQVRIWFPAEQPLQLAGRLALRGGRPWGIATEQLAVRGRLLAGGVLEADELTVAMPHAGRVMAHGRWPLGAGEVEITAAVESVSLAALPVPWRGELTGRVAAQLRLTGDPADPLVEGSLHAAGLCWQGWEAEQATCEPLLLWPRTLRGSAVLDLAGVRHGDGRPMRARVRASRWSERLTLAAHLIHSLGEFDLEGDLDPAGELVLRNADWRRSPVGNWRLEAPLRVAWGADRLVTDSLRLISGETRCVLAGDWDRAAQQLDGELTVRRFPLARLQRWLKTDSLAGQCDLRLAVSGRLPDPLVSLDWSGQGLAWGDLALGGGRVQAAWVDSALAIGPVELSGPFHRLRVPEILMRAGRPLLETLRPPGGEAALAGLADAPWIGLVHLDRLDLTMAAFLGPLGDLPLSAHAAGSETHIDVAGQRVAVRVIAPWDLGPAIGSPQPRGVLSGALAIGGTAGSPALHLVAAVPDLRFAEVPLGALQLEGSYVDSLVRIEQLTLLEGERTTWGRGFYPLRLALLPPTLRPTGQDVRLRVELDELNLAVLSALTPWLPDASGRLSGRLTVEGTGAAPALRGTLTLSDGGFRIPGRSERIYEAEAQVDVTPAGLQIRSLDARTGPHGTLAAVGTVRSSEAFDLSAVISQARIYEQGRYDVQANADLNAYTAPGVDGEGVLPHLDGTVEILLGTITQDLAAEGSSGSGPGAQNPWLIDLDIAAPGNLQLSQVNVKAELGEGELHLTYRWPQWNASGTLKILGGTYRLLNNAFTIQEGTVEFRDTGTGPDLTLDVDAETYLALIEEEEASGATVTVQVHVYGKPDALEIDLASVPPLSDEEIIELLSIGRFTRAGRFAPAEETQWILLNTMVDRLEASLMQQSPIFARVAIAPGTTDAEPLRVTLRPVVTPAFRVNYSQDLALDPARELSLHYRLSRVLYLRAGLARDRRGSAAFNEEYSLDLKCRFEYE